MDGCPLSRDIPIPMLPKAFYPASGVRDGYKALDSLQTYLVGRPVFVLCKARRFRCAFISLSRLQKSLESHWTSKPPLFEWKYGMLITLPTQVRQHPTMPFVQQTPRRRKYPTRPRSRMLKKEEQEPAENLAAFCTYPTDTTGRMYVSSSRLVIADMAH
jgi:hypothetical protein